MKLSKEETKKLLATHLALKRVWWVNLYPDGQCGHKLHDTEQRALHRCTFTGEIPDAIQVAVRIVPL